MFLIDSGSVNDWLLTGYVSLTLHANCSLGQSQLLVGEVGSGKTTLLSNIGLNNTLGAYYSYPTYFNLFFYNFIGSQSKEFVYLKSLHCSLNKNFNYFVDSTASVDLYTQIITPHNVSEDCLVLAFNGISSIHILDSLSNHANLYRAFMLGLKSSPGSEAYPGDIFYLHASLLERYGSFNYFFNAGSTTSLPVANIQNGDITDYITTNLISITDGQWFFSNALTIQGMFPSFDVHLSVSSLGDISHDTLLSYLGSRFNAVVFPFLMLEEAIGYSVNPGLKGLKIINGASFYALYFYKIGLSYISLVLTLLLFLLFDGFSFCCNSSVDTFSNLYFLNFSLNSSIVPIFWSISSSLSSNNNLLINYVFYLFSSVLNCR